MSKRRSDHKLSQLTDDQEAKLWEWLNTAGMKYRTIVGLIESEFGLKVSTRALSEWWQEKVTEEEKERFLRAANVTDSLGEVLSEKAPKISKALKAQLLQKAFELSLQGGDVKLLTAIMDIVSDIDSAETTKAKISLDLEKFRESIKSQQEKALDALFAEIRGNEKAEQLFYKFRDAVREAAEAA